MEQYISKSDLVEEIKRLDEYYHLSKGVGGEAFIESLLSLLDTLEVKEVDSTPNIRFPHYKSIVEKVFGAGNLESFEYDEAEQLVSLAKEELLKDLEVKKVNLELENDNPKITAGTKIRSKENPDIILRIISDDCHGDEFECSNGSVLSLKQIEKYYDII